MLKSRNMLFSLSLSCSFCLQYLRHYLAVLAHRLRLDPGLSFVLRFSLFFVLRPGFKYVSVVHFHHHFPHHTFVPLPTTCSYPSPIPPVPLS